MITSLLNTLVYYVDAKLFDYYHYALIFGVLGMRILTGLISGAFTAAVSLPILASLRRAGIASGRTEAERE